MGFGISPVESPTTRGQAAGRAFWKGQRSCLPPTMPSSLRACVLSGSLIARVRDIHGYGRQGKKVQTFIFESNQDGLRSI
jgi:hypothetical protein